MPTENLNALKVAVLATDGVEMVEILEPIRALKQAGAVVKVVAPKPGEIQSYNHDTEKAERVPVEVDLASAESEKFDALFLPGGTTNADHLRLVPEAVAFVRDFVRGHKPIAAMCHGPWALIEAGGVRGKRLASWPSLRTDLNNAGATWTDEAFVRDGMLVTSRGPRDLPVFIPKVVEFFMAFRAPRAA